MQESKRKDVAQEEEKKLEERRSEATNAETLKEIEESETGPRSRGRGRDPGPSPDGTLDERDELKDAGPM